MKLFSVDPFLLLSERDKNFALLMVVFVSH